MLFADRRFQHAADTPLSPPAPPPDAAAISAISLSAFAMFRRLPFAMPSALHSIFYFIRFMAFSAAR